MGPLTRLALVLIPTAIIIEAVWLFARRDAHAPDPLTTWEGAGSFLGFVGVGAALLPARLLAYGAVASASPLSWDIDAVGPVDLTVRVLALYVAADLCYYLKHRVMHGTALGRRLHEPHHSSRKLSLVVAIRLSWAERASADLFFLPLALLGAPAWLLLAVLTVNHFSPFMSHTTLVPRLGWLDRVVNTPAVHRVHHAPGSPTANLGATLLIWDHLFGTYVAPSAASVPVADSPARRGVLAVQLGPLVRGLRRCANPTRRAGIRPVNSTG